MRGIGPDAGFQEKGVGGNGDIVKEKLSLTGAWGGDNAFPE